MVGRDKHNPNSFAAYFAKRNTNLGSGESEDGQKSESLILVGEERVELSRPCGQWILSPSRLPFRHSPFR